MKSKRTKACEISNKVKAIVWERDRERCVCCGSNKASPVCHFISRAQGGLGIEENIVTLCAECHYKLDQTTARSGMIEYLRNYLKSKYPNWNEEMLVYKKWTINK